MKHIIIFALLLGNLIYSQNKMNTDLLYNWQDESITSTTIFNLKYQDIWGYSQNNREYAIIGSTRGIHIFDITDLDNVDTFFVMGNDTGKNIIHRDMKTFGNYLYCVSDEGNATLQIIDLSGLPNSIAVVKDTNLFGHAHNIFIDTSTQKMYVCGSSHKFEVYSLLDPKNPSLLYKCDQDIPWWASQIGQNGYVHDCYSRNDTLYLNAASGLYVVDFSVNNPILLFSYENYIQAGYNHSGFLSEDGTKYVFADETHGSKMKLLDVSDFSNVILLDTFMIDNLTSTIAHNQLIKDNYIFVSNYYDGLCVYDMIDPYDVKVVAYYDTYPGTKNMSYKGCWGVYPFLKSNKILVSDMQTGLYVLSLDSSLLPLNTKFIEINKTSNIYPNPNNGSFSITDIPNNGEKYECIIYDINGKVIYNNIFEENNIQISLDNIIISGTYFVKIYNNKLNIINKFVLNNRK